MVNLRVEFSPQPLRSPGPVRWTFHVRNAGTNPASLAFRTTQQGEVILEAGGAEIYRWGRDKMFAAALEERALNPGQTWTFTLEDTLRIEPGPYRLTALIPARPVVPPFSTSIVVEPE